ncbi:MAG: 4Fe-4S binding protein [Firmicutes bacterium]|nr:4Fe-4S binding protein [Bacillota bacterium]
MFLEKVFLPYMLPVLIFLVLGGVIGFCLKFFGEKAKEKRDPRIDESLRFLPGTNCGGCGCAGCEAFAEKLVCGKADISMCGACSPINRENIGKSLGVCVDTRRTAAVVHCNGTKQCKNKYNYHGYGNCRAAELVLGGAKACPTACLGLSSCVEVCPYNALSIHPETGSAVVNSADCTSCGLCLSACPKKIISRIPTSAKVYVACSNPFKGKDIRPICPKGCIACKLCEKACPKGAISVLNSLAMIDYDKCTGCGKCIEVCPSHCIVPYEFQGLEEEQ